MYNEIMETNGFLEFFSNAGFLSLAFNAEFPQFLIKRHSLVYLINIDYKG